jgi:hypothetical protein
MSYTADCSLLVSSPMTEPTPPARGLISKVLSPAIQMWLRSQVEQVEHLQVEVTAGDRQLLAGTIPRVMLRAQKAVYQGLHLSDIDLTGQDIQVNLRQVIRGKPLQLLQPIAVQGRILLAEADLNASLQAPLLANTVKQFLCDLLRSGAVDAMDEPGELNLQNLQMRLLDGHLRLRADLLSLSGQTTEIALQTGLQLTQPNQLQLTQPQWLPHANAKRGLALKELEGYGFDLGADTQIQSITITEASIICMGRLMVQP